MPVGIGAGPDACAMLRGVSRHRWLAAAILGLLVLAGCAATGTSGTTVASTAEEPVPAASLAPAEPTTDLPTTTLAQLPAEAIETLELIESDGPFPFDQDGATFQNREGILPKQPSGFYREYTVATPGEDDRGARRIVTGKDGSRFYTADHYASFHEVISS